MEWQRLSVLLIIGLHACSDSKGVSNAQDASVGGGSGSRDASVGGGSGSRDASVGGGSGSRVRVTVLSQDGTGVPDTSAIVIFADSLNQLVSQGLVGPIGRTEADLPEGGTVSALRVTQNDTSHRFVNLVSIRNVKPGDELIFGTLLSARQHVFDRQFMVRGGYTPVVGATTHLFDHPCGRDFGEASAEVTLTADTGCLPERFDVLAYATSFRDPTFVPKYAWATATAGGGFVVPAMQDMPMFTATIVNSPLVSFAKIARSTLLAPYYDHYAGWMSRDGSINGRPTISTYYAPAPVNLAIGLVQLRLGDASDGPEWLFEERIAGDAASATIEPGTLSLPLIQSAPRLSGKVVSWTQLGNEIPDARAVTARSTHTAGGWIYDVKWTTFDAASDSAVALPGLPEKFAELDPTQQLVIQPMSCEVIYVNYSNIANFDEARRQPLESLVSTAASPLFGSALFSRLVSRSFSASL